MKMITQGWIAVFCFCLVGIGVGIGIPIGGLIEQNHPAKPRAEFEEIMSALEAKVDEMRKLKSAATLPAGDVTNTPRDPVKDEDLPEWWGGVKQVGLTKLYPPKMEVSDDPEDPQSYFSMKDVRRMILDALDIGWRAGKMDADIRWTMDEAEKRLDELDKEHGWKGEKGFRIPKGAVQAPGGGWFEYRTMPYYGEQVLTNHIPYMPTFPINPYPDVVMMTNGVWRVFPKE